MSDIAVPDESTPDEEQVVTDGFFEEELYVDAEDAGAFLVELGRQLQEEDEVELTGEGWRLPFAFGEPIELDIEFQGDGEPELEVEVELPGRAQDEAPDVS